MAMSNNIFWLFFPLNFFLSLVTSAPGCKDAKEMSSSSLKEEKESCVTQYSLMAGICRLTFSIYLINYYCIRYDFLTSRVLFEPGLYHAVSRKKPLYRRSHSVSMLYHLGVLEIQLSFLFLFSFTALHTRTPIYQSKRFIFSVFMTLIAAFTFQILISAPLENLRSRYFCPLVQPSLPPTGEKKIE